MVQEPKSKGFIKKLQGILNLGQVDSDEFVATQQEESGYRSLSEQELNDTFKDIYVPNTYRLRHGELDKMQIPTMIEPLGRELAGRKAETAKLIEMSVESRQAAGIMIPSILTPNDFSKNVFQLAIESEKLDETTKQELIELFVDFFGENLGWKYKLSVWVDDAMYKVGSKAIMIFPSSIIHEIRSQVALNPSNEALQKFCKDFNHDLNGSIESLTVHQDPVKVRKRTTAIQKDRDLLDSLVGTIEQFPNKPLTNDEAFNRSKRLRSQVGSGLEKGIKALESSDYDLVKFSTDPKLLFSNRVSNSAAMESIDTKILDSLTSSKLKKTKSDRAEGGIADGKMSNVFQFDRAPYLDLSDFINKDQADLFPAIMELPSEAVIPIIVEGSPDNHLGYFILLNENGTPVSINVDNWQDLVNTTSGNQRVDNLFSSFYGNTNFSITQKLAHDAKTEILGHIYDSYLRQMLTDKLDTYGFTGYEVRMASDVSRVMLSRLMQYTETRVLFAPKKLVHYLAFEYHDDGTGRSKIDSIKFPLSLKIMFIVVRLMALIESSINRTRIRVGLDDTVGNPLEVLRNVKKKILESRTYGISYDPTTIIRGVLDKAITVMPSKIPGVEDFSIEEEPNDVNYPRPDDGILDEVNNMHMMGFGVPPSAMNRLGEDEFSRSVAANNIFFSNQLREYQIVICKFVTEMVQSYIGFSSKLRGAIEEKVNKRMVAPEEVKEDELEGDLTESKEEPKETTLETGGEADADEAEKVEHEELTEESTEMLVEMIVSSIDFVLASPDLAHDKSSFEELNDYIQIIDTVIGAVFPNELVADSELGETLNVVRSQAKSKLLIDHVRNNSILSDLELNALDNVDLKGITETAQKLLNLKAALTAQLEKMKPGEGGEAGKEEGGDPW